MTEVISLVEDRLRLYGEHSEQWKTDHYTVQDCWKLEDNILIGLESLKWINRINSRDQITVDVAEFICTALLDWYEQSLSVNRIVELFEQEGYEVEGADELRAETKEVAAMQTRLEEYVLSMGDLKQGKGISLKVALNDLQSAASAKGC